MRSETEIREMMAILRVFGKGEDPARALAWVLGEYPPKPSEEKSGSDTPALPQPDTKTPGEPNADPIRFAEWRGGPR